MNVQEVEKIQMELLGRMWEENQNKIYGILEGNYNQGESLGKYDIEQINRLIAINQYIENVQESINDGEWNEELWDEENKKSEEE